MTGRGVCMEADFIIGKAREKAMARMYDGGNVYLVVFLGTAVFGVIIASYFSMGQWAGGTVMIIIYLLFSGSNVRGAFISRRSARKRLDGIIGQVKRLGGAGSENYAAACRDLEASRFAGGFYFGGKYLFSPYGILAGWDDIRAAEIRFYYHASSRYRIWDSAPYRKIVVSVRLSDGRKLYAEIFEPGAIRNFNEETDRFTDIIRERCGVRAVKLFT